MNNTTFMRTDLRSVRDKLSRQLERVEEMLAAGSRYGADVYEVGAVLRFDKTFHGNPRETYPYVAIKSTDGYWRTSGPTAGGKAWTWDELTGWLASGTPAKQLWEVTGYVAVVG